MESDQPEENLSRGTLTFLTFLLQAFTLVGALLFLIGWSYGRAYYGAFGIGLNQLEIPLTSYLAWVYPLIFEAPIRLLLPPALVFSVRWWGPRLLLWLSRIQKLAGLSWLCDHLHDRVVNPGVWTLVMLLFFFMYEPSAASRIADQHANRDSWQQTTTLPKVLLQLKVPDGEDRSFLDRLRRENISDGSYIFLGRHRQMYYLMPYRGAAGTSEVRVLILPESVVRSLRVVEGSQ